MRLCLLIGVIEVSAVVVGYSQSDSDLLQIAKDAFSERAEAGGLTDKEKAVAAFRKPFLDLSDASRIRALALSLYDIDETDPRWSMSSSVPMGVSYALGDDPEFIADWSALRGMLREEKDPRKFYLLSELARWSGDAKPLDFVSERCHMLFEDGRVTKEEGEYTKSYASDVSLYAYEAILGNLRVLGADFPTPAAEMPHEEQVMALANWLKMKWPGCEGIKIPVRLAKARNPSPTTQPEDRKSSPLGRPRVSKDLPQAQGPNDKSGFAAGWIVVGGLIIVALGILSLLVKKRE